MTGRADRWIRRTTIGCVTMLALIVGTVSYLHMHDLVSLHGQPGWVAALTPLSVDGMILAASTTLLSDSRSEQRGGVLPWALLVIGSVASLAANVAVAEPTATGRVIAAWPSFALIGSYELLMRQVGRESAAGHMASSATGRVAGGASGRPRASTKRPVVRVHAGTDLRRDAWQWAQERRAHDGCLPSGREIARQFGRHERWGRMVKRAGVAGQITPGVPS